MEKAKVFTAFYHISELRSREDLMKGIIENIDYTMYVTHSSMQSHAVNFGIAMVMLE